MKFIRIIWEDLYQQILNSGLSEIDEDTMIRFLDIKQLGMMELEDYKKHFQYQSG